jgi:hypothetical protein
MSCATRADVSAWSVGQRQAQMLGELRQTRPQVADPRAVKALDRLVATCSRVGRQGGGGADGLAVGRGNPGMGTAGLLTWPLS